MDKYLTYSVVERKDPQNPEMGGKFYAQAQARGEAGIRELSQRIQQMCTVTRADVMAVLIALEDVVSDSLSNGEIVEQMKENVKALIGEKSFSVNEGHDKNDFGAIESITGCFIQMQKSEEKEWIKLEPAGYDTEFNISFTEDKHGFHNGCPLLLPDITRKDPESKKKGLGYAKTFTVASSDRPRKV